MFKGQRLKHGVIVYHNDRVLSPAESLKLVNHSPTGFEWGYGGSGPAQLSLAILLSYTQDKDYALGNYQKFLADFISKIKSKEWVISKGVINDWIKKRKIKPPEEN